MTESAFKLKNGVPTIEKDPNSTLDYTLELTEWLEVGDTIIDAFFETTGGLSVLSHQIVGTKIVAWVTGGTVGTPASVTYRFTTNGGRVDDRTLAFLIKDR